MAKITIYCDGSSIGNPGPGAWGAVVMYHDSESIASDVLIKVVELGGTEKPTTNNRMELMAAIESLKFVAFLKRTNSNFEIDIHTDSTYLIKGITRWIFGWQKNNWQTAGKVDVLNRDLWEELIKLSKTKKISWHHVKGHSGIALNERVDEIANGLARGEKIKLFHGTTEMYTALREVTPKKSKGNKGKAYSYVSLVDGQIMTHKNWDECENLVKGITGAKFKKARSALEEKEIISSFKSLAK